MSFGMCWLFTRSAYDSSVNEQYSGVVLGEQWEFANPKYMWSALIASRMKHVASSEQEETGEPLEGA